MTAKANIQTRAFSDWVGERQIEALSTNFGAAELPFQKWRSFKEAFAPELVARAVRESRITVSTCLDPFGGSGTTPLACQFLGIHPIVVEVNPYLADLIEAKLTRYDVDSLTRSLGKILRDSRRDSTEPTEYPGPPTLVEPGIRERWIFGKAVFQRIVALRRAIDQLPDISHQRFFRTIFGGILISVSNVTVSGKGRRYRRNWRTRRVDPDDVNRLLSSSSTEAILDLNRFSVRPCASYQLIRGDSRDSMSSIRAFDLAVFSPPYPNSFDYTDVYNIELWTLGYLSDWTSNTLLRRSTMSSHVQIKREFHAPPHGSSTLDDVIHGLQCERGNLWNPWIPEMIGAYFSELVSILRLIHRKLADGGACWMAIGNSCYNSLAIDVPRILTEILADEWLDVEVEPIRSMRSSAQQGGNFQLTESLMKFTKAPQESCTLENLDTPPVC